MLSLSNMKSLSAALLVCVAVGSNGPARATPGEQAAAGISGRVSPCVKLSLGQEWQQQAASNEVVVSAESVGLDTVQVVMSGATPSSMIQLAVPLEIRTNVAYELKLVLISVEGCGPDITTSVESIRPSGAAVSAGTVEAAHSESLGLGLCSSPTTSLRGTRVSARGNFNTRGNALLANLALLIPSRLIPSGRQQCSWRVAFRISLHSSI